MVFYAVGVIFMTALQYIEVMRKNSYRVLLTTVVSSAVPVLLLIYTDTYKSAVSEALYSCADVLIPSLFPFFVLSSFTVYTGSMHPLTRRLGAIASLLAVPREGLNAVILSIVGGFPVGAKTASMLYKEKRITSAQAEKLVYCCVGAGPGFLVTFLGENLLGSKRAGLLLLCSDILSVLTLLILYRKKQTADIPHSQNKPNCTLGEAVVLSTEQAVHTALQMCGFVVIFTVINKLLSLLHFYNGGLAGLLEITCGTIYSTGKIPLELTAFFIGFGGLCVHFQIYGIAGDIGISKLKFTVFRIIQGILSAGCMYVLMLFFPVAEETFSNIAGDITPSLSGTVWGGGAVILLSVIFLISIGHNKKQEVNLCAE